MSEDVPSWEEIMTDLVTQGRTDEALTIAHMLAFRQFCDDLIDHDREQR